MTGKCDVVDQGAGSKIQAKCNFEGVNFIRIRGANNTVIIDPSCTLKNLSISISGSNNLVQIYSDARITGGIGIKGSETSVSIGSKTTFVRNVLITAGEGKTVKIGSNCMFSRNIEIRNTDEHPIWDKQTLNRINQAADVHLGDNIWVGEGVYIGKGVIIPSGSIIGARSVVTKPLEYGDSLYAGSPAKLLRENIQWAREFKESPQSLKNEK